MCQCVCDASVVSQVSQQHGASGDERADVHATQRPQSQNPDAAQPHPSGDLPSAQTLQKQSTATLTLSSLDLF